jgi:hypothetical protein
MALSYFLQTARATGSRNLRMGFSSSRSGRVSARVVSMVRPLCLLQARMLNPENRHGRK